MNTLKKVSGLTFKKVLVGFVATASIVTLSASRANADSPNQEEWLVHDRGANKQEKVIANNSNKNSLSGDPVKDVNELLKSAQHDPEVLRGLSIQFGTIDKDDIKAKLASKAKDGKVYINKKGQNIYYRLKGKLATLKAESTKIDSDVNARNSGISNGEFVLDSQVRNFKGQNVLKLTDSKNKVYYNLDYCGNCLFPANKNYGGIGQKSLPTPPKPKEEKPSNNGTTPPPPTTNKPEIKIESKNPNLIPDAKVGGGKNINPGVDGPAVETAPSFQKSYQAPAAPSGPSASPSVTTSPSGAFTANSTTVGGKTYNNNIHNSSSGSFSDVNGKTKMENNGAVSSPRGNYSPLVGTTPPAPEKAAQPSSSPITDDISEPE